ncbi:MAG TPA: hypothetical protein VGA51_19460 [Casimicrobiaceae bacterium]
MPTVPATLFRSSFTLPRADVPLPALMQEPLCASDQPLALLPVRLETRFFAQPDGSSELRVRIYPDKIHLDSHERELTRSEREWGVHAWESIWRAGNDVEAQKTAWRQLADRFADERAAWILHALEPTNNAQRPTSPTAAGQPLPVSPAFAQVAVVDDDEQASWRRAPVARLMPDSWFAIVQSDGRPVIAVRGRDIEKPVAVGPDPQAPPTDVGDETIVVDKGMQWMVDFDVAEAKGMALRIPIPAATLAAGLDGLLVLGVTAAAPRDVADELADLIDAHHYTDGLEFLHVGTPTNNTADRRAGYQSGGRDHDASFAVEVASDPATLDENSNAMKLGVALGLPRERIARVLGYVGRASEQHDGDQRCMNGALWQASWGYYLGNMIGFDGTGFTPDGLAWARDHFLSHVRAAGSFACVRAGRQPYGLLPVTSLDLWKPGTGAEVALSRDAFVKDFLIRLRDIFWRPKFDQVARVGQRQDPPDPDADLADVMRTEAFSTSYRVRSLFGRHYLQHLRAFIGEDLQAMGFIAAQDAITGGVLQRLGIPWRPRMAAATFAELSFGLKSALVQSGEVSPWKPLEPDYIAALLAQSSIDALIAARPAVDATHTSVGLLQTLLRHGLLREIAEAAARIAAHAPGANVTSLLRDAELNDLVSGSALSPTFKRQLDTKVAAITGDRTIREVVEDALRDVVAPTAAAELAALAEFRASLKTLQRRDSETLQLLMQGALDLASYRLDAWITSFASKRLATLRAQNAIGLRAGGYGWVENLRPKPPSATIAVTPPPGESLPLVASSDDTGFVHAPSATHAAAAALLRNAHLGASGITSADSPFAIELSSRRAREAARLIDGTRQGQPLGALLGYRFERSLHDLGLDRFIAPLRNLAPLAARRLEATNLPVEKIAANNVVDGLVLSAKWHDAQTEVTNALQPVSPTADELASLRREFDGLADAIDGLSDALTAEIAYQMARGNTSRTAATLAAIAQGDAPAPELEVARIPRSGTAVTHRVLALWSGANAPAGDASAASPMARAEPALNAWAGKLLGDFGKVRCTFERVGEGGAVLESRALKLSELSLAPLDVVYGVPATGSASSAEVTASDIEARVVDLAQRFRLGFSPGAQWRIQHVRPTDLASDELTLFDVLEQARAARRLLATARSVTPQDLSPPSRTATSALDLAELEARVVQAEASLRDAHGALAALAQSGAGASAGALRTSILKLGDFGFTFTVPVVGSGDDPAARAALSRQASGLLAECSKRIDRVTALRDEPAATDPRSRFAQLGERMRAVFGSSFVVLARFTCDAATAGELRSALAGSKAMQGGDELAVYTWFARYARVRDPVARLASCVSGAEVLGAGERLALEVAQLPFDNNDRWIGLPPAANKAIPAGKLSLVVHAVAPVDFAQPLRGLWIDEWTEIVPSREETTAVTFQYNPPDACAPQTVLLAVPPVPGEDWTVAALHRVLVETLDLAKLRAVDSDALSECGQFLPALCFAFNAKDDAVSTDFAPLTR